MVQQRSHFETVCGSIIMMGNATAKDIIDEMPFESFEDLAGNNIDRNGLLAANFWQFVFC
jgi:hypothetical protein